MVDVRKAWREGFKTLNKEKEEKEKTHRGTYRGGSSGILLPDGMIAGNCHRRSLARSLGHFEPEDESKALMFRAGERNEDTWLNYLNHSRFVTEEGGSIEKCDNAVELKTKAGTLITGSPDVVFFNRDGEAVHGLELKHISSIWTARKTMFEGGPKLGALIQSALYMHGLGLTDSYDLIYTNSVNFSGPDWATKLFPAPGESLSEFMEFTYYRLDKDGVYKSGKNKGKTKWKKSKVNVPQHDMELPFEELKKKYPDIATGDLKHLKPFFIIYHLRLDDEGVLNFRLEGTDEEVATPVDVDSVMGYYEYLDEMRRTKNLGPRPLSLNGLGEFEKFRACDYCELLPLCDKFENDFEKWKRGLKIK